MIAGTLEIQLLANMARLQKDMDGARRSVGVAMASIEKTVGAAKTALSGLGGGLGLSQIINLTDQYTKFTAQLKLATNTTSEYATAYADVQRIAKTAQADLGSTGVLYARIANGTRELGVSQTQVAAITETVNLALKVSGATAAESSSAMLQLSQSFASGALRGEEFNAVNEAAPRLMQALADGIGKPVGALKEMASDGKLTSEVLAGALPKALAELRKEAAAVQTISGAFQLLKNEVMQFIGTQAQASGAVNVLTTGIGALANNLGLLAGVVLTIGASKLAQWAAGVAVEMYAAVTASQAKAAAMLTVARADVAATAAAVALTTARVAELRSAVLAAEGNVALAVTTNGLIPAQARAAAAATAHSAALLAQSAAQKSASAVASVASGALGLLGGPIGWITTLLGLGATAWALWGGNSKKAEQDASTAVQNSTEDIVANLDAQIKKLKERNALALAGLPGIGKSDSPEANKMASLKAQMDAASAGTGDYAGLNQAARNDILAKLGAQYGTLYARIQSVNEEKAKLESTGQAGKLTEWMEKYATKAEKLAAELAKAKKELGAAFTPEIESRIREQFAEKVAKGPKAGKSEAAKQAEEAARFIAKLKEEAESFGLTGAALVAYQAKKEGYSLAVQQESAVYAAQIDMLKAVDEARKSAAKAEAEAAAAAQQKIATAFEAVDSLQLEIDTYDMLPAAITRAEIAKLALHKATLDANQGTAEEIRVTEALILAKNRLAGLQDTKTKIDKQKESVAELKKIQDNFVENVQRNLGSGLFDMMNGSFKGIGDSFKKMLLQMVADAAAANITAALFGNPKQNGSTGILSGALTAGLGFLGIAGAKADGGHVNGGSTYLVGERGPELFKSSSSGTIVPNHAMQGGASPSVTVQNTYNIDSRTDQSTIVQMLERNKAQTKADIQREMQRSRNAYSRA